MKKIMTNLLVLISIIGLSGCSSEPETSPVRIEAKTLTGNSFMGPTQVPIVEVTSLVDSVVVEDVIVNNGNCKMTAYRQKEFPKTLGYGQMATAGYTASCNLIKVDVVTDQGNWTVEY